MATSSVAPPVSASTGSKASGRGQRGDRRRADRRVEPHRRVERAAAGASAARARCRRPPRRRRRATARRRPTGTAPARGPRSRRSRRPARRPPTCAAPAASASHGRAPLLTGECAQREQPRRAEHERDVDPGREDVEQAVAAEAEGHGDVGGEDDHEARPHHPQGEPAWNFSIHQLLPSATNLSSAKCRDNRAWTLGRGHVPVTGSDAPDAPETCAAASTSCAASASAGVTQPRRSPSAPSRSAR